MQEKEKETVEKVETNNLKTIIIDDVEYNYKISKMDKINGLSILLTEKNVDKNITFKYEKTLERVISDIKALSSIDTIEEMISSLQNIFLNNQIEVEKKEEK